MILRKYTFKVTYTNDTIEYYSCVNVSKQNALYILLNYLKNVEDVERIELYNQSTDLSAVRKKEGQMPKFSKRFDESITLSFTQFNELKNRISEENADYYAGLFYSTDTGLEPERGIMKANYGMTNRAYQALLWGELLEIWGYICMGGAYHLEEQAPYFIHIDHSKKQFNYGYC